MVKLQLLIVPNVTGYVHIQTNPKLSYSTEGTISDAYSKPHALLCYGTY